MVKLVAWLAFTLTVGAMADSGPLRLPTPPLPPGMGVTVALTNVQSAIRTLIVPDVTMAIQAGGANAEAIAYWCRAVADTFASMRTNGNFLPTEIDRAPTPLNVDLSGLRTSIFVMYTRAYDYRSKGDLPPLEWLSRISVTFSEAIREGIKQGGKGNVLL